MQHSRIGERWTILRSLWKVAVLRDRRNEFRPGDSIAFERVSRWLHRVIRRRVTWPLSLSTLVVENFLSRSLDRRSRMFVQANIIYLYIFITEFNRTCSHYLQILNFAENLYRGHYHRVPTFFIHSLTLNFLHPNLPFIANREQEVNRQCIRLTNKNYRECLAIAYVVNALLN